ncbi:MAG: hypothetical protein LDL41_19420, partial [Coleofasciculus sp. S288]|nr:hypothetical protein [Coleofasciculus sp. S288]
RSEVEKIVGAQAFTIDDEQLFSGEEILVVNASGVPFRVPTDGTELQVTGEVREFDITTIAREFNLDFDPNTYLEYEDKPVIIAKSFALAPKPGEITRNPGKFYNQVIAVEAEVEKTFGPITFTLDEDRLIGGSDLLVLKPLSSPTSVEENEKVVVIGVLRPFVVSELDREYELTKDLNLQRRLDLEHRNKPVLLAKDIFRVE